MKARTVEELRRKLSRRKLKREGWPEVADRVEIIVDCITNLYGARTVTVDRDAAQRIIGFCRRLADGRSVSKREMVVRETEMINFLRAHNQSLDWVFGGDPTCMIVKLADGTSSTNQKRLAA